MSDSIYRGYGLHEGVSNDNVQKLAKQFKDSLSDPGRTRRGVFLGIDFLRKLVDDLTRDEFDGIIVKIGKRKPQPGIPDSYELVATQLELEGGQSFTVARRGLNYSSKGPGDIHPPDVGCPPIDGAS